jgi:hypothetical protein
MHQGLAGHAGPECRDDVGVTDLRELMALPREAPNVFPRGFVWLLLATLHVPGVAGSHVCALELAHKDVLEILLIVDLVSW